MTTPIRALDGEGVAPLHVAVLAGQAFEARYTEDANDQRLMTIYQQAITVSQEGNSAR